MKKWKCNETEQSEVCNEGCDTGRQKKLRRQYLQQFYRGNMLNFIFAALSVMLTGSINLSSAWLMQQMIDWVSGVPGAKSLNFLVCCTVGIVASIVLFKTINYIFMPRFMEKAMRQYKDFAFQKITQKSIASFQQESTAGYISAFSNDALSIETNYLGNLFTLLFDSVMFLGAIIMMLAYSPLMTLTACGFFVLPIAASLATGKKVENAEREVSDRNEHFVANLKDSLSGFSVIKSFKAEKAVTDLFHENNVGVERAKCRKRKITTVLGTLGGMAGVVAQFGTFLAGGYMAAAGMGITPGVLLIFIDLTAYVINPIRSMPELWASCKAAMALVDKLAAALEENVRETGVTISNSLDSAIEMKHVSFGYSADEEILHNINMRFEKGKSYAIVGASGSGKSTMLNLLMASHNGYKGEILYDGQEVSEVSSESLYDLVSLIQQNVFVFNASIRDNITMFREFSKEEIDRAIKLAGLSELIDERGEDYLCGENGSALSGGEKQRISIARSLLRKSSVLLVDEATAALDTKTAWQISDAILGLKNMTRIVVTHSLEERLLKRYDCVIALKNGEIAELGSFEALMEEKGYFYSLCMVNR